MLSSIVVDSKMYDQLDGVKYTIVPTFTVFLLQAWFHIDLNQQTLCVNY